MKGFKDKNKKFHPVRKKRSPSKVRKASIVPKLQLKLPKRKESFAEIESDIKRNVTLRERLANANETIADKIEANPKSTFTVSRAEQIKANNQVIKGLNNDIKSDLRKLTKEERKTLSDDVKNVSRFL